MEDDLEPHSCGFASLSVNEDSTTSPASPREIAQSNQIWPTFVISTAIGLLTALSLVGLNRPTALSLAGKAARQPTRQTTEDKFRTLTAVEEAIAATAKLDPKAAITSNAVASTISDRRVTETRSSYYRQVALLWLTAGGSIGILFWRLSNRLQRQTNTLKQALAKTQRAYDLEKQAHQAVQRRNAKHTEHIEKTIRNAHQAEQTFLANMSHEFRTPLNAILGMTEGLQEGIFGTLNAEQMGALNTVERSGSHLLELINDILSIAKIESNRFELNFTPTAAALLCQTSLAAIAPLARPKSIHLDLILPHNLPSLWIDEPHMHRVLVNLLTNAVKFTPKRGRITLEVTRGKPLPQPKGTHFPVQNSLQITVIDTGIGIDEHHLENIFEPFVQIDSGLNREHDGTGLGLALVKSIVELHGGHVQATSKRGIGSRFGVTLPCVQESLALESDMPTVPVAELGSCNQHQYPSILLVSNQGAYLDITKKDLIAEGYDVIAVSNYQEAVAVAWSKRPDLVLIDEQRLRPEAIKAIQIIRQRPHLADLCIVAMTDAVTGRDRETWLNAGVNGYLHKPTHGQLKNTIQQFLGSRTRYGAGIPLNRR